MAEIARLGALLIVHAEDAPPDRRSAAPRRRRTTPSFLRLPAAGGRGGRRSRLVIDAARRTGGRAHVVHLSSADALPMLRARPRGRASTSTVETCPHYLTFDAEDDRPTARPSSSAARRSARPANRDALWAGLAAGDIDCVVSDHSPCTAELKRLDAGDFGAAWGGIASVQLGLPAVWTAARARGHTLADVVRWMADGARPTGSG